MENELKIKAVDVGEYQLLYVLSDPPRLEAKIVLGKDDISQKLLFTMMEISHQHGFSCSPPVFGDPESSQMTFLVGTVLPGRWSLKKYSIRMRAYLDDMSVFMSSLQNQLNFNSLDVSMFGGLDFDYLDFSQLAAMRDQNFGGSWLRFRDALVKMDQRTEVIDKCALFEKENDKDLGLVGHKLKVTLREIEGQFMVKDNTN